MIFFFFPNFILGSIFTFLLSNIVSVLSFEDSNRWLFRVNSQEETKSYLSVLDVFHLFLRGCKKVNNSRTIKKRSEQQNAGGHFNSFQRFPGQAALWGLA